MKETAMNHGGFTLVEMMIAIAVFGIVMTGVYNVYVAQLRSNYTQQRIMDMQQNIRAAFYLMEREIKMAGINPSNADDIGIGLADAHTLRFSMDFTGGLDDGVDNDRDGLVDEGGNGLDDNDNGLIDEADEAEWYDGFVPLAITPDNQERVEYVLSNDVDANGRNDGLPTENDDGSVCHLWRNGELLAQNIDALNFVYLDSDGVPLATPVADTSSIRSIQVTLVARSGEYPFKYSYEYIDNKSYQNQQGIEILPQQNDSFRRISMTMEAKCRNMGL